jgi:tetratricopeptide (TPR) repeat protein
MDLMDFTDQEQHDLYYSEALPDQAAQLLATAATRYGTDDVEQILLKAFFLAPQSLQVLVALYRFYFFQQRYQETLVTAHHALQISGQRLQLPSAWQDLTEQSVNNEMPVTLLRFYLLALKGAAYVTMRLGDLDQGAAMIDKVILLDPKDRLGASVLKEVFDNYRKEAASSPESA